MSNDSCIFVQISYTGIRYFHKKMSGSDKSSSKEADSRYGAQVLNFGLAGKPKVPSEVSNHSKGGFHRHSCENAFFIRRLLLLRYFQSN
jgi:hypothetical protein